MVSERGSRRAAAAAKAKIASKDDVSFALAAPVAKRHSPQATQTKKLASQTSQTVAATSKSSSLFDKLCKASPAAIPTLVKSWMKKATKDMEGAVSDLVFLILDTAGADSSKCVLERQFFDNQEEVLKCIDSFDADVRKNNQVAFQGQSTYAVKVSSFRNTYLTFWAKLFKDSKEHVLFHQFLLDCLPCWLSMLSISEIRSFRHTATVTSLQVIYSCLEVQLDLEKLNENFNLQQKSRKSKAAESSRSELVQKIEVLKVLREYLEQHVFAKRAKDICPQIRKDCLAFLGKWMERCPNEYLDGKYLKYVSWALYDKDKDVRECAVQILTRIYSKSEQDVDLKTVAMALKGRLIEMLHDVSSAVARQTIALLTCFVKPQAKYLESSEMKDVIKLLCSTSKSIRKAVANFVAVSHFPNEKGNEKTHKRDLQTFVNLFVDDVPNLHYIVDTLWPKLSFLSNWNAYLDIFLESDAEEMQEGDIAILAQVLNYSVQKATGEATEGITLESGTNFDMNKEEITEVFATKWAEVLKKYRTDSAIIIELCAIVQYFVVESLQSNLRCNLAEALGDIILESTVNYADSHSESSLRDRLQLTSKSLHAIASNPRSREETIKDSKMDTLAANLKEIVSSTDTRSEDGDKSLFECLLKIRHLMHFMPFSVSFFDTIKDLLHLSIKSNEVNETALSILVLECLHDFSKMAETDEGSLSGAQAEIEQLVAKRDFLISALSSAIDGSSVITVSRDVSFHILIDVIVMFGRTLGGDLAFTPPQSLLQSITNYFTGIMEAGPGSTKATIVLTKFCLPFATQSFPISSLGAHALMYYKQGNDMWDQIIANNVIDVAKGYKSKVMSFLFLEALKMKFKMIPTDELERDEADDIPEEVVNFMNLAKELSSWFEAAPDKNSRLECIDLILRCVSTAALNPDTWLVFLGAVMPFISVLPATDKAGKVSGDAALCLKYLEEKDYSENSEFNKQLEKIKQELRKRGGVKDFKRKRIVKGRETRSFDTEEESQQEDIGDESEEVTAENESPTKKRKLSTTKGAIELRRANPRKVKKNLLKELMSGDEGEEEEEEIEEMVQKSNLTNNTKKTLLEELMSSEEEEEEDDDEEMAGLSSGAGSSSRKRKQRRTSLRMPKKSPRYS